MTLKDIIREKENNKKHFIWQDVEVFIKDPPTANNFSVARVLNSISEKIPKSFLYNIDSIYIGDFDFLRDRELNALYENSSIFVTNQQKSEEDMADDIVHEIAHSIEETHSSLIYSDGMLQKEFIMKRKNLYSVLKGEGIEVSLSDFLEPEYSENFDQFLYQAVGYPMLNMVGSAIFYSPYAATSLREYFANGFEAFYYFGDYDFISKSCPVLFRKLSDLMEGDKYDYEY